LVEDRASQNSESVLVKNVEFARGLIAFPSLPHQQLQEGAKNLEQLAIGLKETLKLDVEMFLGPDGEPIEGAV
jgi:hypothetical protein